MAFHSGSAIREVNGEAVILLGAGRALLMQLAHPLVARGVTEHSSFRRDRLGRLLRTLRPMYAIAFGTPEEADAAARGVNAVHRRVAGAGYTARDPELLLWVHATLVDTSLELYSRFVRPLAPDEEARCYADMSVVGRMLGVPDGTLPPDPYAFREYLRATIDGLEVTGTARAIAAELRRSFPPAGPLVVPMHELTVGLLPPRLREQYGFDWGPRREVALRRFEGLSRRVLPLVPAALRRPPALLLPPSARPRYRLPSALGAWRRRAIATLSGAPPLSTARTRSST